MSESGMVRAKRTRERRVFVEAEKGEGVCGVWRSERVGECVCVEGGNEEWKTSCFRVHPTRCASGTD